MTGQLCLKWNNHSSAFDKLLSNLHLKEMYSDATLVCHGKFYPVHRFVLTTCSEYFEEIFSRCVRLSNKQPFIIVKDINPLQMEALLNYMYKGEVNVPQEMLPELIKAAEAFKIKGLAVPDDDPPQQRPSKRRANNSSPTPQSKKSRKLEDKNKSCDNSDNSEIAVNDRSDISASNKGFPSSSKSTNQDLNNLDLFGSESMPNPTEIKSEPVDVIEQLDNEEKPENVFKEEQTYETFAEPYPVYNENNEDSMLDDQFDASQSSAWDNSQDFEGNESLEGDQSQRELPRKWTTLSVSLSETASDDQFPNVVTECPFPQCSYKAANSKELEQHFVFHTTEKPFKSKSSLHLNQHPKETSAIKDKEEEVESVANFVMFDNLNVVERDENGKRPCPFPGCAHRAGNMWKLKRHFLQHTGEKPFQCPHCCYKTTQKQCVIAHVERLHPKYLKLCSKCGLKFVTNTALLVHNRQIHSATK